MPTCFIICPIGDSGTETRTNADDLRDLIIKPTLEPFGFRVDRGDHHSEQGKIDNDVIRSVQEADLCIVDISLPNPNVYYELGRRDETGKPFILLRSVDGGEIPVDIATCRYVEYDLDSRRGIVNACNQLRAFVEPIVKRGFESSGSGASLSEIAEILKRMERKLDRIKQGTEYAGGANAAATAPVDADPIDMLKLALRQRNIPMAEQAMDMLRYRMSKIKWMDQVVEQVAVLGSVKAGNILIDGAMEFIDDNGATFHEKIDYLACLVGNLNKTDREMEHRDLVEQMYASLEAISFNESESDRISLSNQMNRLYHGIFSNTGDRSWLDKAIRALQKALEIGQRSFLYYNLSICERNRNNPGDMENSIEHALHCIKLDGERPEADHLEHLCILLHDVDDPRLTDFLDILASVNSIKAQLLRAKWKL